MKVSTTNYSTDGMTPRHRKQKQQLLPIISDIKTPQASKSFYASAAQPALRTQVQKRSLRRSQQREQEDVQAAAQMALFDAPIRDADNTTSERSFSNIYHLDEVTDIPQQKHSLTLLQRMHLNDWRVIFGIAVAIIIISLIVLVLGMQHNINDLRHQMQTSSINLISITHK
jgi:hypothetical protein